MVPHVSTVKCCRAGFPFQLFYNGNRLTSMKISQKYMYNEFSSRLCSRYESLLRNLNWNSVECCLKYLGLNGIT